MTIRKALIFALFLIPSPLLANMVICNAPHAQGEAPAGCTESSSFFVVTSTVGVSSDDATQLTTTMALTASTSAIVDATNEYFGAIFATVTIPSGATITGATVQMYFPAGTNDEPQHSVSLQYSTYAPTFTTGASDISSRQTTSSSVSWSSANLGAPGYFVTPDLSTQLTEVYNITGSLTNARLAVIVRGGATATRDFQVLTQDNGNVPQTPMLSITYAISTTCYAQNFAIAATSQTISSASWTANSNNPSPTSYTLQYGTATDFTGTLVSSTTLNLFATVTGLTANTQYYARVRSDPDNFYSATASTRTPNVPGAAFATDDFNRADGDLDGDTASGGGTWDDPCNGACADFVITSNVLGSNNAADWNAYTHSATPPSADYYSQLEVTVADAAHNSMGPALQVLDNNNYVGCYWTGGGGDWDIILYSAGSPSTLADGIGTNPPTTTRTVKLSRSGTTYTCTSDGVEVASGTDSTFSNAEKAGIMSNYSATSATIDNFEAGQ